MKKIILLAALIMAANFTNAQLAGTLDSTFNNNTGLFSINFGFHDNITGIAIQPDDKIIGTGTALSTSYIGTLKVLRLNSDGTPDVTFANNGVFSFSVTAETHGRESAVRSDGKIVVAGLAAYTFGYYDVLLLRLNDDGTLDTTFGTNGYTIISKSSRDDYAQAMTLQPDGKIVISGAITDSIDYFHVPTIFRFTESGLPDSTFGTNGYVQFPAVYSDNELNGVIVQPDGKIVASGHYDQTVGGFANFDVVMFRVDSNGVPDSTFGTNGMVTTAINGGVDDAFGMAADTSGNIVLCGFTTPPTLDFAATVLKYNSNGVLDSAFGTNGLVLLDYAPEDVGYDLKVQPDNKLVIGGTSGQSFLGPRDMAVWRLMPDGSLDSTFGNNGMVSTAISPDFQDINALGFQSDLNIVAGIRTKLGANNDMAVVRFLNDVTSSVAEHDYQNMIIFPNPVLNTVHLNFGKVVEKGSIEIFNIAGMKILSRNISNAASDQFGFNEPGGIYFVKVTAGDFQTTYKIVVM